MDVNLEELFQSIPQKHWRKFLSGDYKKQKAWLRKHLLVGATAFFSALVLNKVQWTSITLKVVKAIVGNRLSEALPKFLGIAEMVDSKAVKRLEKQVVKEVIKKIQSSTNMVNVKKGSLVKRSIHKLFNRADQTDQQRPQTPGLIKPIIKGTGKHGVYKKYRGGNSWFKEGVPELPTIVEVSQEEEMSAELSYFVHTVQEDTEEFVKMLTDSRKAHCCETSLLSNDFDFQEQPSHGGVQIFKNENNQACNRSQFTTAEKKSTKELSSEGQSRKEYVSKIIRLVLCQALESSDKICYADVFQDIFKWTLEKVWDRVQGKQIQFRSREDGAVCRCSQCSSPSRLIMRKKKMDTGESGSSYRAVMAEEHQGTESGSICVPVRGTAGDPAVSVPRGLGCADHSPRKKLILHMDLNNTILVSDTVTGQGTVAALDYFLTTVTWGKMSKHGKWEWLSDSASLLPPCSDASSYYSQFGRSPGFTSVAGRRFKGLLEEHLELLRWPEGVKEDRQLSIKGEDGRLYHWILPSFFQLIRDLAWEGREFAIVFRTFGTDLPRVLKAMSRVVNEGAHPLFPDLPELKLRVDMTPGKIRCTKRGVVLSRAEERVSTRDGERGLYQYLSSVQGLGGFQDHFDWWATNTFSIRGGKPLWIDPFDQNVQHVFIDDNIRQNDEDTIVCPKVFLEPGGHNTRAAGTAELYDISLVQTDLLRAISDRSYFTQRVHICLENYERNLWNGTA